MACCTCHIILDKNTYDLIKKPCENVKFLNLGIRFIRRSI